MSDLFHTLLITHAGGSTPGERVDIGWRAWASRAPQATAGRWLRLRFWLALWRFFGQQHYLVQVDDHHLLATSVRVLPDDDGRIRVTLMQRTSILGHCLRYALWQRRSPLQQTLIGQQVRIGPPPQRHVGLPLQLKHCPEALLDSRYALSLPVALSRQR